jgi:hypothetical protein
MSSPSLTGSSPNNPTKYLGPSVGLNIVVTRKRAPTGADIKQPETGKYYSFGTIWLVGKDPTTGVFGDMWYLSKIEANVAYWVQSGTDFTLATDGTDIKFTNVGNDWLLDFNKHNIVIGSNLDFDVNSDNNTALGYQSLSKMTSGSYNCAVGYFSGNRLTSGNNNTLIGPFAGERITTGFSNCAVGNFALAELTTGSYHTVIGDLAGAQLTGGSRNIILGRTAGNAYTSTESHNILLGSLGVVGDNNLIRIGNEGSGAGQQNECYIAGVATTVVADARQLLMTVESDTGRIGHTNGYVKTIFVDGFATAYHATSVSSYNVLVDDCVVGITDTTINRTMNMPTTGMRGGQRWTFKDQSGNAGAAAGNNIIISGNGANIDGALNYRIDTNFGSVSLYWSGSAFFTF